MTPGGALDPQGPVAATMADLWWLMLWVGLAVFVVFAVLLVRAMLRGSDDHHDPADERDPNRDAGRLGRWFVGWGVVGPTVVLVVVFGATVAAMRALPTADEAGDEALVVEVVGRQWSYDVTYPASGVTTRNELHLPVGREVVFELTSADVIHSFWVPSLGGKVDMMPDRVNTMVLQADEAGEHTMRCAEFCGLEHARMMMPVVAEDPADFEAWLAARVPGDDADG